MILTRKEETEQKFRQWIRKHKEVLIPILEHRTALFLETGVIALKAEQCDVELERVASVIKDLLDKVRPFGEVPRWSNSSLDNSHSK